MSRSAARQPDDVPAGAGPALVTELLRPESYPAPRPGSVALAATHASWVFLTEHEAWKIKRPVDLGFLDFSTPERRRRSCEEEVRLGRRLAPDVYAGVAPVFLGPHGHRFVGPGRIVDHAVRMRRLADGESAQALLGTGQLSPAHLDRLAGRLARFYDAAPLTPEAGSPAVLAANIAENHAQVGPYLGRFLDAPTVGRLQRWQEGALAHLEPALAERLTEDRVRDGHGDLRLEHVYFPGGTVDGADPLVIDPIDFNRRFRCQDVALDVAFLAMELDAAGRADLAAWFLSSFARATNDYGFYPLLDLYLCYRAFVRAKVACLVAGDPGTPPGKAARKRNEAAALLALAASYTRQRRPAAVLAVGGLPGAGKSTVASALSVALGLPVISSDHTRKHLGGVPPTTRADPSLYTDAWNQRTLDEMVRRARLVLASGRGVVLDATFRDPAWRGAARDLAADVGAPFRFVEMTCDEATIRSRLRARGAGPSVSDAREQELDELRSRFTAPDELSAGERLAVDGRLDTRQVVSIVRQHLG